MNQENFCYWLKGYFEISRADSLNEVQVQEIRNHLDLALNKSRFSDYFLKPNLNIVIHNSGEITGNQYCCGTGPYGSLGTIDKIDLSDFSKIPMSC